MGGFDFYCFVFFLSSKSICDVVFGSIASFLAAKNAGGPLDGEIVFVFAKFYFSKELPVFVVL